MLYWNATGVGRHAKCWTCRHDRAPLLGRSENRLVGPGQVKVCDGRAMSGKKNPAWETVVSPWHPCGV